MSIIYYCYVHPRKLCFLYKLLCGCKNIPIWTIYFLGGGICHNKLACFLHKTIFSFIFGICNLWKFIGNIIKYIFPQFWIGPIKYKIHFWLLRSTQYDSAALRTVWTLQGVSYWVLMSFKWRIHDLIGLILNVAGNLFGIFSLPCPKCWPKTRPKCWLVIFWNFCIIVTNFGEYSCVWWHFNGVLVFYTL